MLRLWVEELPKGAIFAVLGGLRQGEKPLEAGGGGAPAKGRRAGENVLPRRDRPPRRSSGGRGGRAGGGDGGGGGRGRRRLTLAGWRRRDGHGGSRRRVRDGRSMLAKFVEYGLLVRLLQALCKARQFFSFDRPLPPPAPPPSKEALRRNIIHGGNGGP